MFLGNFSVKDALKAIFTTNSNMELSIERYIDGNEAVLTSSGRVALYIILKSLDLNNTDNVLCTSFNCPAVIDAIYSAGVKPRFVDINISFQMDIASFKESIDPDTKAVILTHAYGVHELDEIVSIAKKYNIVVINDIAQYMHLKGVGLKRKLKGDFCVYSFERTKPLASFGGGIAVNLTHRYKLKPNFKDVSSKNNLKELDQLLKYMISCTLFKTKRGRQYGIKIGLIPFLKTNIEKTLPTKMEKITDKRIGTVNLKFLFYLLHKNKEIYRYSQDNYNYIYMYVKKYSPYVRMLPPNMGRYNYATLIFQSEDSRWIFSKYLAKYGVQTTWLYYPLHKIPIYQTELYLENTESLWKKTLSIPFKYPYSRSEMMKICDIIGEIFNKHGREIYGFKIIQ